MRAKEVGDTGSFSLSVASVLASGETLSSVTGTVSPTGPTLSAAAVSGTSVTWSLAGGTAGRYYLCSFEITTSSRTLRRSAYVAVVADGSLQEYPTVLDVLNDARVALRDQGANLGTVSAGFTYGWEQYPDGLLWSNDRILRAYNEMLREVCRRRPIHDRYTPALCQVTTVAATRAYAMDTRVLVPITAYRGTEIMYKSTTIQMDMMAPTWRDQTTTDEPRFWIVDPEEVSGGEIEFHPIPDDVYTITLHVDRYPLERETWETRGTYVIDVPHVDREAMVEGMRMLLLSDYDIDQYDPEAAAEAEAAFAMKVGPRLTHRQVAGRRAYGGQKYLSMRPLGR